jgi:hypothetical protein
MSLALDAIPSDAISHLVEASQLLGVDVQQFSSNLTLAALNGFLGLQIAQTR